MSNILNLSRVTVRQYLQTLENEQLIYRRQRLGSFVSDHRTPQSFTELKGFRERVIQIQFAGIL